MMRGRVLTPCPCSRGVSCERHLTCCAASWPRKLARRPGFSSTLQHSSALELVLSLRLSVSQPVRCGCLTACAALLTLQTDLCYQAPATSAYQVMSCVLGRYLLKSWACARVCAISCSHVCTRGALPRLCGVYATMIASSSVFTCARMLPTIGRFGPHWGLDMLGPCLCMPALHSAQPLMESF